MAGEDIRILFEYVAEEAKSHAGMDAEDLQETIIQDREIRQMAEIIREATPTQEPLLYSSA